MSKRVVSGQWSVGEKNPVLRTPNFKMSFLFLVVLSLFSFDLTNAQEKEVTLQPNQSIEREIEGEQKHIYKIALTAGQYLKLKLIQMNTDVSMTFFAPDGQNILESNYSDGNNEGERITAVSQTAGVYSVEVKITNPKLNRGKYEIKIETLITATQEDFDSAKIDAAMVEAGTLKRQNKRTAIQAAIAKLQEVIPLCEKSGNESLKGQVLHDIGYYYNTINEYEKALESLTGASTIRRAANDKKGLASTLNNIAIAYEGMGKRQLAIESLQQALILRREAGDRKGEAITLNNMGLSYQKLGERKKAVECYLQSLQLRREIGDHRGESITLIGLGLLYNLMEETQPALEALNAALKIGREIGDKETESSALNNLGFVYSGSLGEKRKALEFYTQALEIRRAEGFSNGEGSTLLNISGIYEDLGEKQKAIDALNRAIMLKRNSKDRAGEAIALNNLGSLYANLGERQLALEYYNQSLVIRKEINDRRGEGNVLNNIGSVYENLGDSQKAIEYYNQALPLRRAVKDTLGESATLNNMSATYLKLNEAQKALELVTQALELNRKIGNKRSEGRALLQTGLCYKQIGEHQKAKASFEQALALMNYTLDTRGEASVLYQLAFIEQLLGNLEEATNLVRKSLAIIEKTRMNIDSQRLRASYFATVQENYSLLIDLLMSQHKDNPEKGFLAEAFQISEKARARNLLEMLVESNANIREGVDTALIQRERDLENQLNTKCDKLINLLKDENEKEKIATARKEFDEVQTRLQETEAQIRKASPRYAALTAPQPVTLPEVQKQILDSDSILLEYMLGKERSYLWVITENSANAYQLAKGNEIEEAARRVYELLTARNKKIKFETTDEKRERVEKADAEFQEASAALSRLILEPAAKELNKKRLIIVADGALQYVPFAVLQAVSNQQSAVSSKDKNGGQRTADSGQFLVDLYEIVNLPSASTLAVLRDELKERKPAPKTLAVVADPVFSADDERLKIAKRNHKNMSNQVASRGTSFVNVSDISRSARDIEGGDESFTLPRLPFTRKEAEAIKSLIPASQRKEALDFAATRRMATDTSLSQYRIIHFATHGFLNSAHPELSGLVFTLFDEQGKPQDGFLRSHEIYNLNLPADLIVLSACRTGLGKEVKGEGLVGLTRGFMYAGAARVAVSLWDINDEATSELMARFYRGMFKENLSPTTALRQAQISMLKDNRWNAPYYWASFVLQGEPR